MAGTGGKRPGAGRKPGQRTAAQQKAIDIAGTVLAKIDAESTWIALLKCGDPKVIQSTLVYLTNRVHGMPRQTHEHEANQEKPFKVLIEYIGS